MDEARLACSTVRQKPIYINRGRGSVLRGSCSTRSITHIYISYITYCVFVCHLRVCVLFNLNRKKSIYLRLRSEQKTVSTPPEQYFRIFFIIIYSSRKTSTIFYIFFTFCSRQAHKILGFSIYIFHKKLTKSLPSSIIYSRMYLYNIRVAIHPRKIEVGLTGRLKYRGKFFLKNTEKHYV